MSSYETASSSDEDSERSRSSASHEESSSSESEEEESERSSKDDDRVRSAGLSKAVMSPRNSFRRTLEISPSARSKREEDSHEQHHHERSKKGQRKLADSTEVHATEEFDKPSKDISVNDKRASDPVLRERGGSGGNDLPKRTSQEQLTYSTRSSNSNEADEEQKQKGKSMIRRFSTMGKLKKDKKEQDKKRARGREEERKAKKREETKKKKGKGKEKEKDEEEREAADGEAEKAKDKTKGRKKEKKEQEHQENGYVKTERRGKKGGRFLLERLYKVQELGEDGQDRHQGAVWAIKFSSDGRHLATGGNDAILRVWRVEPQHVEDSNTEEGKDTPKTGKLSQFIDPKCFKQFVGHSLDILSLAWSNNDFLLSSSMDCSVRLWHLSCDDCISCFDHRDFVTCVAFHPINNKVFMSGCLDKKVYVWNIPRKRVGYMVEGKEMITAAAFVPEFTDSKEEDIPNPNYYLAVATDTGKILFYEAEEAINTQAEGAPEKAPAVELKVVKEINIHSSRFGKDRHTRRKITAIELSPDGKYILVSSNDSAIRMYKTKNYSLTCKYSGAVNKEFQISSSFSDDGRLIIGGSEDPNVFIWEVGGKTRKERVKACEYFSANEEMTTAARFAPRIPGVEGEVFVTAGLDGLLQVYHNGPAAG